MTRSGHAGSAAWRGLRGIWPLAAVLLGTAACGGLPPPAEAEGLLPAGPVADAPQARAPVAAGASRLGWFLAGRHAAAHYNYDVAAGYHARVLVEEPEDAGLRQSMLTHLVGEGRIADATPLARDVVAQVPHHGIANLVLAASALRRGDYATAGRHADSRPRKPMLAVLLEILGAWVHVAAGETEAAAVTVERESGSGNAVPAFRRLHAARVAELIGDAAAAERMHGAALVGAQGDWRHLALATASFYSRSGRTETAGDVLAAAAASFPDDLRIEAAAELVAAGRQLPPPMADPVRGAARACLDMAAEALDLQSPRLALVFAQAALHIDPGLAEGWLLLGRIHDAQRRHERAVAAYRRVPADTPAGWEARLREAESLDRLDRVGEARELLEAMAAERPGRHDALAALGDMLRGRDRFAEAAAAYDRALARVGSPGAGHWRLVFSRGIVRERMDAWAGAEADLLTALELRPDEPFVLNYLGYSWVELGRRLDEARTMIERAVAQRPDNGYMIDSLGWVFYRLGDFEAAVGHLERAVELKPVDPVINDHLGDAYHAVGRRAEARSHWRRALGFGAEPDLAAVIGDKLAGRVEPGNTAAERSN